MAKYSRVLVASAAAVAATAFVAGCSANSSSEPSPSATESVTGSPTNSPTGSPTNTQGSGANCTLASIKPVIPASYKIVKFQCNNFDGTNWAVVTTTPGPESFFLKDENNQWNALKASDVCGTASAGLPVQILAYCPA
ncbi:MAG: hypothetical protein WAS05_02815 [Candidatus Nanopelagicales bacterium]